MKLIVGLGNPGREYEHTRHNMGFDALDKLADIVRGDFDRNNFKGNYALVKNPAIPEPIILFKPQTYMNLSGEAVRAVMDYFKIDLDDLLVIYDDMDLPEGTIRLRPSGSAGSHNGMRNIVLCLGSENFKRLRIGIGKAPYSAIDYVLGKPNAESKEAIEKSLEQAAKAARDYLLHDFNYAMNHYNH